MNTNLPNSFRTNPWFVSILLLLCALTAYGELIAYDPFVNANIGNGENDKTAGQYNAGSQFRDFTNGNNIDVAGGAIVGFSASNLWEGNSGASVGVFSHLIGPTNTMGLSFGLNDVQGGNVQARGFASTGVYYARRAINAYTPANTYYISGLLKADNLSGNLNLRAMTGFTSTISSGAFDGQTTFPGVMFGFFGNGSQVDLVLRHKDETSAMTNDVLLANAQDDTTYFVVIKIEYDRYNGSEQLTAWLNPQIPQESTSAAAVITTGKMLTTSDQMTYAGFWLENFNSAITDYVHFDEIRMGTQWSDVVAVPFEVTTLSEMAVSGYVRPDYAPEYSDVCFSSRWLRGEGYQENVKWWGTLGTTQEIPMDSFEAMKMYHATRLEWIYLYGDEVNYIPKVRAQGINVSFGQTNNLNDEPGGTGPSRIGRIIADDGNYYRNNFDNIMGCANNEDFKTMYLREAKARIDVGADSLQVDDPVLNDGIDCYCEYCRGVKDGFESTTEFYQWLHNELDAYYFQTYGIAKFPIHGNNSSHTRYTDSYFGPEEDYRLDYGCSEMNYQDVSAQHFHNVGLLSRTYLDQYRPQMITSPGTWGYTQPVYLADFTNVVRRSIGTSYAQGINMLAPFDRFGTDLADGGDQNQESRFFGNPQYFADMFGFIRGIAIYLDGYEFAWDWGATPKAIYHDSGTPYSDTWGTAPGAAEPVVSVDDGIAVVIRAKPGENDEPIAIHLVDWSRNDSFTITLNNEKYFGEYTDNLRLTLLEPLDSYNAQDYAATWDSLSYTYYVKSTVLSGSYSLGQTTIAIPRLSPWAVLMVSKGKNDALPLYDSSRWQQRRDIAPAYAVPYYPANNAIVTPIQSIMLSFDKELDPATITATNFIVKHEQTGGEIDGTWAKLGNLARFTPAGVYPKGTISVELTTNIKRTNGVPCLRQKFYYNCNLNVADLNLDMSVDILDLADIATGWLRYTSTGDVTSNGYVNYADIDAFADNWLNCYVANPQPIFPADGTASVSCGTILKWEPTGDFYDVYFGTDESSVANADFSSPEFMQSTSDNFYTLEPLLPGTEYYWRIDTTAGGCSVKGDVYSFTTTDQKTLAYWELDSDGANALASGSLRLILGSLTADNSYVSITNPDQTMPWNSTNSSSQNDSSLYFDGLTALVANVPDSPFQFKRSVPFTCEAYISPSEVTPVQGIIFGTRDGFSSYTGWYLRYDGNGKRLSLYHVHPGGSNTVYSTADVVGLNSFKHVALVWDPSTGINGQFRAYVDGVAVLEFDGKDYWDDKPACGWNFMVGGRNVPDNPWAFKGLIDELRWSNYALDPSEFLNASMP